MVYVEDNTSNLVEAISERFQNGIDRHNAV